MPIDAIADFFRWVPTSSVSPTLVRLRLTALDDDGIGFRSGGEAALLVLLAGAAGAGIVAADLRAVADLGHDRCEVVVVVAVRAVDVPVMAVVVPMVMIVVAIGAMNVASSCGLGVGRAVGHASVPVRGCFFEA